MAKVLYAGTASDFVVATTTVLASPSGTVDVLKMNPGASLEAWNAGESGSQITDILLFTGSATVGSYATPGGAAPSGVFPAETSSTFLFWAEDTFDDVYVVGAGLGVTTAQRWKARPVNDTARLLALEALDPIPGATLGQPLGPASLAADGLIDPSQLPPGAGAVDSVNGETGAVVLVAADVGAVGTARKVTGAGPYLTQTSTGALSSDVAVTAIVGTSAGQLAIGNHTHGGFTTSPRPVKLQILTVDAPTEWRSAAAADPYTLLLDGINDGVEINNAVDLCSPFQSRNAGMPAGAKNIGCIDLSAGRINVGTEGIKVRTGVRIQGQGKLTEIKSIGCNQPGLISLAAPDTHLVELVNFYMNGNSGSGGTCSAINFDQTASGNTSSYPDTNPDSDHYIANLYIDEFRGTGRNGVRMYSSGTANCRGNIVENLQIRDCTGGHGIVFDGCSDSYIKTCHVGGSGDSAYRIAGGNTKLIGNKSFYSNNVGVWVTSGRVNITGHESQDDSTGYFFDGVPGTAVGLVSDTSDVAGIRVSNDRLQIIGFNVFLRSGGRYATQQRGLWFDSATAFTNCAIIGNVENASITTPVAGPASTGTYLVTIS